MKTIGSKMYLRILVYAVAGLLVSGSGTVLRAQPSPLGTWDFVHSGGQVGVAHITFNDDFTLEGVEIITVKKRSSSGSGSDIGRGFFDDDRNPTTGGTNSVSATNKFLYGGAVLTGNWTFDSRGRMIGVMIESGGVTNSITNGISFRAAVKPGVRISMVGVRNGKTVHYRGVPLIPLADQSGDFYAVGKRASRSFTELFTLAPAGTILVGVLPAGTVNGYDAVGVGPAYTFLGQALLSSQKSMAFFTISDITTNGVLRSVAGSYRVTRGVGSLKGVIESGDSEDSVSLKVTKR